MRTNFFYTAVFALLCASLSAQDAPRTSPEMGTTFPLTLADLSNVAGMDSIRAEQNARMDQSIAAAFDAVPFDLTSRTVVAALPGALWATNIRQMPLVNAQLGIDYLLTQYTTMSMELARATLETAYGVYPLDFAPQMKTIATETTTPKHFAMAAAHLLRIDHAQYAPFITQAMHDKWPVWRENPILLMTERLANPTSQQLPPLAPLLSRTFAPGSPVVYSFQRPNRNFEGLVVVRRPDGRFVRRDDGNVWSIAQLTRANSNLPGFITNGNTPEGVHTIVGVGQTRNTFIGRTPFLETALPIEHTPSVYYHDPEVGDTSWTLEMYQDHLPAQWRDYLPFHSAYYAGKAGRSEMLAHGTTANPAWYVGMPYYPNTPSLGCMTAKELWDPLTGKATHSDQLALYTAWIRACQTRNYAPFALDEPAPANETLTGYLVLIQLRDMAQPVTLSEVLTDVLQAEQSAL